MNSEIHTLKTELIDNITSYMKYGGAEDESDPDYDPEFDAGYEQRHIDRCSEILESYFSALAGIDQVNRNEAIMSAVKSAVLALNEVNNECDGNMIETDQREQLCEIIISAANNNGLQSSQYDITEEWRDW